MTRYRTFRLAMVYVAMACSASVHAGQADEASLIDGDSKAWREAATVHASVVLAPGRQGKALAFSEGGIAMPTAGRLTASAGSSDLWCAPAGPWPGKADRTLMHVGDRPHSHVTLFVRNGVLLAVYKGDVDHYVSITHNVRRWAVGHWHHVQFSWQATEAGSDGVRFFLCVDGKLVGVAVGKRLDRWPATLHIGDRRGGSPWRGLMDEVRLCPEPIAIPELQPGRTDITVDAGRELGPCYRFWTVSNFTSQHMFADPEYAASAKVAHPFMRQVNCVRLLGGRSDKRNHFFLGANADGTIRTDFTDLRRYLRGMVQAGYTPCIVLDNVPTALSDAKELHTYGNTMPPKDPALWAKYVQQAVRAMVDEFGPKTVGGWRFRVGTEPDLYPGHWAGTKQQYFDHYANTVKALLSVVPNADVGPGNILNPAGAFQTPEGPAWGLDIIDFAAKAHLPMTYFSCSWYATVGQPIDSFATAAGMMRRRLDCYPQFRKVPVEVAEFGILRDEHGRRLWSGDATEWGASFYAAIAADVYRLNVARVHEWAQTTAGVLHPRASVITLLEKMAEGRRLAVQAKGTPGPRCGAVAVRKGPALWILVYHHRTPREPRVDQHVSLTVRDARMAGGTTWRQDQWLIDRDHGVWIRRYYADCSAAGIKPLPKGPVYGGNVALRFGEAGRKLFHAHRAAYEKLAAVPQTVTGQVVPVAAGKAILNLTLHGHAVCLIRLTPPGNQARRAGRP